MLSGLFCTWSINAALARQPAKSRPDRRVSCPETRKICNLILPTSNSITRLFSLRRRNVALAFSSGRLARARTASSTYLQTCNAEMRWPYLRYWHKIRPPNESRIFSYIINVTSPARNEIRDSGDESPQGRTPGRRALTPGTRELICGQAALARPPSALGQLLHAGMRRGSVWHDSQLRRSLLVLIAPG
jgi:hypothetical protein